MLLYYMVRHLTNVQNNGQTGYFSLYYNKINGGLKLLKKKLPIDDQSMLK